jgi:hypothetical protein
MRTWTTPWLSGASLVNTSLARSMIRPSTKGPRSFTRHVAVAPVETAVMVTTVPIGNVRWAHVPGGAASYQVAPPDWVRPEGADDDPDGAEDFGAVERGAVVGLGAGRVVVGARRTGAVCAVGLVAPRRTAAVVGGVVAGGTVVGGAVSGVSERLTRSSTGRAASSSPLATTDTPSVAR